MVTKDDTVLSITSGGDNTIALLLERPGKLVSIDFNNSQNYLLELKISAATALYYEEYLEFLGILKSSRRLALFEKVKDVLSPEARSWWIRQQGMIRRGIIHGGRFEKFLSLFRSIVLPLVHSRETIIRFLSVVDLERQVNFYRQVWNTRRWRLLFRMFSSRLLLKMFARQHGMFTYTHVYHIGEQYLQRLENKLRTVSLNNNYFMRYCLVGSYDISVLPPYLEQKNFNSLRACAASLTTVNHSLLGYLKLVPESFFSKFNLSDIFESLSDEENYKLWTEIVRTAKPGAIVVYWNNLVPRSFPESISPNVIDENNIALLLQKIDRVFFYGSFHVNKVVK